MSDSPTPTGLRLTLLAMGVLIGVVVGFVALLSYLPADTSLSDFRASEVAGAGAENQDFEFYTLLQGQTKQREPAAVVRQVAPNPVIEPATRVVPGNVQNIRRRNLAAENYAEIQATSFGKESYFLQAGSYLDPLDAEKARARVLLLGLEAHIVTRQDSNGAIGHRVRIGPYYDPTRLTEAKKRLRRGQIPYEIIRVTG